MIQVEHVAWQVQDPPAVARWYCDTFGFRILRQMEQSPFTHFLVDGGGKVVVEIYNNPVASVPDYRALNPLHLHLAFAVDEPEAMRDRLLKSGAALADDMIVTPAGDKLIM